MKTEAYEGKLFPELLYLKYKVLECAFLIASLKPALSSIVDA
jgi:hypothetical protein